MIETKKFSKRIALALITCLIACMGMFALAGCESDEQQAENALKGYLDDFKNGSSEDFAAADMAEFEQMGLNPDEFMSSWTQGFGYEVLSVTKDTSNDNMMVEVKITSKQITTAISHALPDIMSYARGAALSGASQADMQNHMVQMILDQLAKDEPVESTVTVEMNSETGQWVPTQNGEEALAGAIVGNVDQLTQEMSTIASAE